MNRKGMLNVKTIFIFSSTNCSTNTKILLEQYSLGIPRNCSAGTNNSTIITLKAFFNAVLLRKIALELVTTVLVYQPQLRLQQLCFGFKTTLFHIFHLQSLVMMNVTKTMLGWVYTHISVSCSHAPPYHNDLDIVDYDESRFYGWHGVQIGINSHLSCRHTNFCLINLVTMGWVYKQISVSCTTFS